MSKSLTKIKKLELTNCVNILMIATFLRYYPHVSSIDEVVESAINDTKVMFRYENNEEVHALLKESAQHTCEMLLKAYASRLRLTAK